MIEHMFGRRRAPIARIRFSGTLDDDLPARPSPLDKRRRVKLFLELLALAASDPAERGIRGRGVRARHLAAHPDQRARARGEPPRAGGAADHGRPAAVHRRDAARGHDRLAGDRRARRAGARKGVRAAACKRARRRARAARDHVPARRDRRARAEGDRARPSRGDGACALGAGPGLLHRVLAASCGCCSARRRSCSGLLGPAAARGRARRPLGGRAAHAALELGRAGRDRAWGAGDALEGVRLRRQGGRRRDGAPARGGRDLDRPDARGGAPDGDRVALHALPGVPRVDRRDRRHPPHPRPLRGDPGGHRHRREARRAPAAGVDRARDEGSRLPSSPSSGGRTSTWRS